MDRQTDKHVNRDKNITSLMEVTKADNGSRLDDLTDEIKTDGKNHKNKCGGSIFV